MNEILLNFFVDVIFFFLFNDTATTEIYTLSLHDALPIWERVFVASARRCCVCKEFKGRNLEVHHIIHKNQGGDDSFENAIPLCFDCHANAGHYNSKHPKGAKFSPSELRNHRDNWYKLVEEGKFNKNSPDISQQFFITNSFEIAFEIANGEFKNFPLNEVKLLQNDLIGYLKRIEKTFNNKEDNTNYYESFSKYQSAFKEIKEIKGQWGSSHWERIPSKEELQKKFFKNEYVVNYMLRNGSEPNEIARACFYKGGCAEGNYETYEIREAKIVFLALINTDDKSKTITSLSEIYVKDGGFIPVNYDSIKGGIIKHDINELLLEPGKCLLVPYCILLMDFNLDIEPQVELLYQQIDTGQTQDIRKIKYNGEKLTIGPRHFIKSVQFETDGFKEDFTVKHFDSENLLLISRFWECGSCPHLFVKKTNNDLWEYIGEIFSNSPDYTQIFEQSFEIGLYDSFKIIELENEITRIEYIRLDNKEIASSLTLHKNDEFIFKVDSAKYLEIKGKYSLIESVNYVNDDKMKNQKILYKMADMNKKRNANNVYKSLGEW